MNRKRITDPLKAAETLGESRQAAELIAQRLAHAANKAIEARDKRQEPEVISELWGGILDSLLVLNRVYPDMATLELIRDTLDAVDRGTYQIPSPRQCSQLMT